MFSGVAVRRKSWIVLDAAVIDLCQDAPSESVLRAQHTVNGIWDWPPNRYVERRVLSEVRSGSRARLGRCSRLVR
jgi:hypothetical protein